MDDDQKSENPKKRKASQISKDKPLQTYRTILNATIQELRDPPPHDLKPLPPSQIGITQWTSQEKHDFFKALERLGRHDITGIAAQITNNGGSKSVLEVRQYILLLDEGNRRLNLEFGMGEIEATVEIGEECCEALDEMAMRVEMDERKGEEKNEKRVWGDEWLVDWELVEKLEETVKARARRLHDDDKKTEEGDGKEDLIGAAELLRPGTFLALSAHFFMNTSTPLTDNWQSIATETRKLLEETQKGKSKSGNEDEEELPSMRTTAFVDFHALVVQITRRIVSTAIYCAESRMRTTKMGSGRRRKQRLLKQNDVKAALDMLGLKTRAMNEDWWEQTARRCKVEILPDDEATCRNQDTSMEPEERSANHTGNLETELERPTEDDSDGEHFIDDEEEITPDEFLPTTNSRHQTHDESEQESPYDSDSASSNSSTYSQKQETYTTALDTYNSNSEELRLWKALNRSPPPQLNLSPELFRKKNWKLPENPDKRPKLKKDGDTKGHWSDKDKMEYWSTWEVMRLPILDEEFLAVERRKGQVGSDEEDSDSDSDEDMDRRRVRRGNMERSEVEDEDSSSPEFVDAYEEIYDGNENEEEDEESDESENDDQGDQEDRDEDEGEDIEMVMEEEQDANDDTDEDENEDEDEPDQASQNDQEATAISDHEWSDDENAALANQLSEELITSVERNNQSSDSLEDPQVRDNDVEMAVHVERNRTRRRRNQGEADRGAERGQDIDLDIDIRDIDYDMFL